MSALWSLLFAPLLLACGGSSFVPGEPSGPNDAAPQATDSASSSATDAGHGDTEASAAGSSNDGQSPSAPSDGGPAGDVCTPVAFPLPAPSAACAEVNGDVERGSLWVATSSGICSPDNESAALAACEACAESFTCACVAPVLEGTVYACAIDAAGHPFARERP